MRTVARILMLATISCSVCVPVAVAKRMKASLSDNSTMQANDAEGFEEEDAAGSTEQAGEEESRTGNEAGEEESSKADDPEGSAAVSNNGIAVSCGDLLDFANLILNDQAAPKSTQEKMSGYEDKCNAIAKKTFEKAQQTRKDVEDVTEKMNKSLDKLAKVLRNVEIVKQADKRRADEDAKPLEQKQKEWLAKKKIEVEKNKAMQQFCETPGPHDWTKFTIDVQDTTGDLKTPSTPLVGCAQEEIDDLNSACDAFLEVKNETEFHAAAVTAFGEAAVTARFLCP